MAELQKHSVLATSKRNESAASFVDKYTKPRIKYPLGSDVDKDIVFDFPFLIHEETVSYIQNHGKVMFLMRGPPSTGKATLSEMITEKYKTAAFCCADRYFQSSFNSPIRTKETLKLSHDYCAKKAETACKNNTGIVIVQNTHMRKWEMQLYINLAAQYNYTVIMAITLYRFDVTPEALLANNTDGLDINYFRTRMRQWEDILPVLTGWFLGPNDASHLRALALKSMKELVGDGKFCRVFNVYDADKIGNCFKAREVLCGLAGYTTDRFKMKKYYLSDVVQNLYGICFSILVLGYHITKEGVNAILQVTDEMNLLILKEKSSPTGKYNINELMSTLATSDNIFEHGKTTAFVEEQESSKNTTATLLDWEEDEDIDISRCTFIHLAQKDDEIFNIEKLRNEVKDALQTAASEEGRIDNTAFTELDSGLQICRVCDNEWLVKAPKKIAFNAIFSGLYV